MVDMLGTFEFRVAKMGSVLNGSLLNYSEHSFLMPVINFRLIRDTLPAPKKTITAKKENSSPQLEKKNPSISKAKPAINTKTIAPASSINIDSSINTVKPINNAPTTKI